MDDTSKPVDAIVAEQVYFEMVPHWMMDHPLITGNAIRLYLQLRRYAGQNGHAYPSRRKLAEDLRLSIPTIDSAKTILVDIGAIEIQARVNNAGEQTSNLYLIRWKRGQDFDQGGVKKVDRGGLKKLDTNSYPINTDPPNLYIHSSEGNDSKASTAAGAYAPVFADENDLHGPVIALFDVFWKAYPRKAAIGAARRAWAAAIQKAKAVDIIDAARRFDNDPNRQELFTPHAATWLNQERWLDGPLPGPQRKQTAGDARLDLYKEMFRQLDGNDVLELEDGK